MKSNLQDWIPSKGGMSANFIVFSLTRLGIVQEEEDQKKKKKELYWSHSGEMNINIAAKQQEKHCSSGRLKIILKSVTKKKRQHIDSKTPNIIICN